MKIYTRTGDDGTTGLYGGLRVSKHSLRIRAVGDVDELNAALGMAASHLESHSLATEILAIQNDLFTVGADLATPADQESGARVSAVPRVVPAFSTGLEPVIDTLERELPPLTQFILPGGSVPSSHLHFARAICRRAERSCVALTECERINPEIVKYLNRLSDLLFVMARVTNARASVSDVLWRQPPSSGD